MNSSLRISLLNRNAWMGKRHAMARLHCLSLGHLQVTQLFPGLMEVAQKKSGRSRSQTGPVGQQGQEKQLPIFSHHSGDFRIPFPGAAGCLFFFSPAQRTPQERVHLLGPLLKKQKKQRKLKGHLGPLLKIDQTKKTKRSRGRFALNH